MWNKNQNESQKWKKNNEIKNEENKTGKIEDGWEINAMNLPNR